MVWWWRAAARHGGRILNPPLSLSVLGAMRRAHPLVARGASTSGGAVLGERAVVWRAGHGSQICPQAGLLSLSLYLTLDLLADSRRRRHRWADRRPASIYSLSLSRSTLGGGRPVLGQTTTRRPPAVPDLVATAPPGGSRVVDLGGCASPPSESGHRWLRGRGSYHGQRQHVVLGSVVFSVS
jgi:hypothetical protein